MKARAGQNPDAVLVEFTYDGPVFADRSMDVRLLGPALVSVGGVVEAANRALNGEGAEVRVNVHADFRGGSFVFQVDVQQVWEHVRHLSTGDDTAAVLAILTALGLAGKVKTSVVKFLRWLNGRTPEKIEEHGALVSVTIGKAKIDLSRNVFILANDPGVRKYLDGVVTPLQQEGVESVSFRAPSFSKEKETIVRDEVSAFSATAGLGEKPEEVLVDTTTKAVYTVVKPAFVMGYKWLVDVGGAKFSVSLEDKVFWQKLVSHEVRLGPYDALVVEVAYRAVKDFQGNLKVTNTITKVLDVRYDLGRQGSLFDEGAN
ncbi:MAG: hypothetical protein EPN53_15590 [Acidobacteria bacterium]|nr:MAG: hypothetical protein EPN53_15590 [Acidobacteriota bacterium]